MRSSIVFRLLPVALCVLMLFPYAVYADEGEKKSPESWLNDDERTYVGQMRAAFSECRDTTSKMKSLLAKPVVMSGEWGVEMAFNGGLLTAVSQPFCNLLPPETMDTLKYEHDRLCALASSCAAEAQNTGNQWCAVQAQFNFFRPMPYIHLLNNTHSAITRLESAIDSAESKLNNVIADIAEEREKTAELIGEILGNINCFIATAVYNTGNSRKIQILREFRDEFLLENPAGEVFVKIYYRVSPPVAQVIGRNETLRLIVKKGFLDPVVEIVELTRPLWY